MRFSICAFSIFLVGASPATKPGEKVWDMPGLHGTTEQIRMQVHQELDDLDAAITEAKTSVKFIEDDIEARKRQVRKMLLKSDKQYAHVCGTLNDAKASMISAKKWESVRLQNKIDGFEGRKMMIEQKAFSTDKELNDIGSRYAERKTKLNDLYNTKDKAIKWRQKLACAVIGSYRFHWPSRSGDVGVVGPATIKKVHESEIVARGEIFVPVLDAGAHEGITTTRGYYMVADFVLNGMTTDELQVGQHVVLDQAVKLASVDLIGEHAIITANRSPNEIDGLLEVFREWQVVELEDARSESDQ